MRLDAARWAVAVLGAGITLLEELGLSPDIRTDLRIEAGHTAGQVTPAVGANILLAVSGGCAPGDSMQVVAAEAAIEFDLDGALSRLMSIARTPDGHTVVRQTAAQAMLRWGNKQVAEPMRKAMAEDVDEVVAQSLGEA